MKTEKEIMESVTDAESACKELGIDISEIVGNRKPTNARQAASLDRDILDVIAEALRQGFIADYSKNTPKWFPVFAPASSSGFVFVLSDDVYWTARTGCGVRQVFPSKALADYYGTKFLEIHKRVILNDYKF